MDKAQHIFHKLAQTTGSKLHWYGPQHLRGQAIRREFAQLGHPISAIFPVATDTTSGVVTLMGYRGKGFKGSAIRKTGPNIETHLVSRRRAKKYLSDVAASRGKAYHGIKGK